MKAVVIDDAYFFIEWYELFTSRLFTKAKFVESRIKPFLNSEILSFAHLCTDLISLHEFITFKSNM